MKALIYTRVSTTMQEDRQSLHFQIEKCKDFCQFKGFEVYNILEDVQSGADDDREGFIKLQKEIDKKSFDILVVYESSRVSRKTITMLNFILELEKAGIKFVSISQPELDTTTPTGMLFFQIQSSLGEYERKQISHRVKSNKFQRAKDGKFQGGNLPIGYKKDSEGNTIIDEPNALIVKNIFTMYKETKSLSVISKRIDKNISSILWILKNHFYIGLLPYGRRENNINTGKVKINKVFHTFKAIHPPIIEKELFEEVQELLKICIKTRNNPSYLLFSGMLHCTCGGKMYQRKFKHWRTKATKYSYRCEVCKGTISKNILEKYVVKQILNLQELNELNEIKSIDTSEREKIIQDMLNKLRSEKDKLVSLYTKGFLSEDEIENKLKKIEKDISGLLDELDRLKTLTYSIKDKESFNNNLKTLKEVIANRSDDDINDLKSIFKLMIERIDINSKNPLDVHIVLH